MQVDLSPATPGVVVTACFLLFGRMCCDSLLYNITIIACKGTAVPVAMIAYNDMYFPCDALIRNCYYCERYKTYIDLMSQVNYDVCFVHNYKYSHRVPYQYVS